MSRINLKPAATLREAAEVIAHGLASAADLSDLEKVAARYAVAVTPDIAALIDPGDPEDPIARQFIPSAEELAAQPGENADPIGDHAHSPVAGVVHRYPDRVLFKLVHVCAVYCRFCFRREMVGPGKATALSPDAYNGALDYIRAHSAIWEVILTGGDPLMLSQRRDGRGAQGRGRCDLGCTARQSCQGIDRQRARGVRRHDRRRDSDGQPVGAAAWRQ
jgi:lysine 2,3-aminomutase